MFKTSITSADPQGRQAVKLFETAYNGLELDEVQAQCVNEHGGEFKKAVQEALKKAVGVYWFGCVYPKQYRGARPINDQIEALTKIFPNLRTSETLTFAESVLPTMQAPFGSEGWFAIPRWEKVAENYRMAVNQVLTSLVMRRRWKYSTDPRITDHSLINPGKPNDRMLARFKRAIKGQIGDVIIIPAQFGRRHRDRSLVQAHKAMHRNEFGLGAFAVGCMLLTHHNRLTPDKDRLTYLNTLICPGDGYRSGFDDGRVEDAPSFGLWSDGGISFWRHDTGSHGRTDCTVTGFVPSIRI